MTEITADAHFEGASYDPKFIANYRIALYASEAAVAYALFNASNEVVVFRRYLNREAASVGVFLDALHTSDSILRSRFAEVKVVLQPAYWLAAPAEFLPAGAEAAYLESVFGLQIEPVEMVKRDFHRALRLHVIYLVEPTTYHLIQAYFPNAEYRSVTSQALETHARLTASLSQNGGNFSAGMLCGEDYIICTVFNQSELLFCNIFACTGAEDALYYMSSVAAALELAPASMQVFLTGWPRFRSPIAEVLKQYYRVVDVRAHLPAQLSFNRAGFFPEDYPQVLNTTF